jgi:hypothetical protein
MTVDLFIKTCERDAPYHAQCLRSIDRFCTGFRDTVVRNGEHPKGYLDQQIVKLHADTHSDADMFLVTDSDTLFTEPVTPVSFMRDGKPIWYMTPWNAEMLAHPGMKAWFDVMKNFFGEDSPAEFMRRQPFMFPREVLVGLREFCMEKHGIPIEEYVYREGVFSEWNVLGMYCWLHHRDLFYWMDTDVECPPMKAFQMWSHAPIGQNMVEIERILA